MNDQRPIPDGSCPRFIVLLDQFPSDMIAVPPGFTTEKDLVIEVDPVTVVYASLLLNSPAIAFLTPEFSQAVAVSDKHIMLASIIFIAPLIPLTFVY